MQQPYGRTLSDDEHHLQPGDGGLTYAKQRRMTSPAFKAEMVRGGRRDMEVGVYNNAVMRSFLSQQLPSQGPGYCVYLLCIFVAKH